jgi:hypothetical protein
LLAELKMRAATARPAREALSKKGEITAEDRP